MDLSPYGIEDRWPRLRELRDEIAGLERQRAEQQATVARLQHEVQQARESDLNAEARAVQTGGKKPKPKAPDLEAKLFAAEHDAEILARAESMSRADLAQFVAANRAALRAAILDALHVKARELAEHSLASLALFNVIEDSRYVLKDLREPEPEPEELPEDWRGNRVSNTFINLSAAPPTGLDRGTIEQVLTHLAALVGQFEDRARGAA